MRAAFDGRRWSFDVSSVRIDGSLFPISAGIADTSLGPWRVCPCGVVPRIAPAWRVRTRAGAVRSAKAYRGTYPDRPPDPEDSIGKDAQSAPMGCSLKEGGG